MTKEELLLFIKSKVQISKYTGSNYNIVSLRNKETYALNYIRGDRASIWGNPIFLINEEHRYKCLNDYKNKLFSSHSYFITRVQELIKLKGNKPLNIACWCAPKLCHLDLLAQACDIYEKTENYMKPNSKNKIIDYRYCTTKEEVEFFIPIIEQATEGCIDTEVYADVDTYGKEAKWYDFNTVIVRLLQLYINTLDFVLIFDLVEIKDEKVILNLLRSINKIPVLVAHNAIFDIGVILGKYNYRLNIKCSLTAIKTINLGYGLKSSSMRGYSLLAIGRDYFDFIRDDKSLQASDWSIKDLTEEQLIYSALDVMAPKNRINPHTNQPLISIPLEVYKLMYEYANSTGQKLFFMCDQAMCPVLADMKRVGLPVNKTVLKKVNNANRKNKINAQIILCKLFGWKLTPTVIEVDGKLVKEYELNDKQATLLNSPKALPSFIYNCLKEKGFDYKLADLTKETLTDTIDLVKKHKSELQENNYQKILELLETLREYKKSTKVLSEGEKALSLIRPTGNIHRELANPGTVTGRFAGKGGLEDTTEKMNLQAMSANDHNLIKITLRELIDTSSTIPGAPKGKIDFDKILAPHLDPDTLYDIALSFRGSSIAPPGMLFADSDAGGQEMVNAAYLSGEKGFLDVLRTKATKPYIILPNGKQVENVEGDLHTQTAIRMYPEIFKGGTPETIADLAKQLSPIGKSYRQIAKIINFSLLYGKNASGFAEAFGCTEQEAVVILNQYFASYPYLKRWLDNTAEEGKTRKYISTAIKGRLYIAEANSKGRSDVNTMKRKAPNAAIQGLSATQIKLALLKADKEFDKLNTERRLLCKDALPGKIIIAIHDQITALVPGEYTIKAIDSKGHIECEFDDTAIRYKKILSDSIIKGMVDTLKASANRYTPGEPVYATADDVLSPFWIHG